MATVDSTHVCELDSDQFEVLSTRTVQLSALLATLYGEGYQSFKTYNEDIQENTLWLAHDVACEIAKLVSSMKLRRVTQ